MAIQECHLTALLLISVLGAILGSLQVGYHTGNVNAPAKIMEEFFNQTWKDRYNETLSEQSLTLLWSLSVSIKDFGSLLGSLGVKYLADNFGRRNSILIVNCLSLVGVSLMVVSKTIESFEALILGRLLFGLFCGLVMSLNPLYVQEVSPTVMRGAFATLNQVSFASGILLGMVSGLETMLGTEELWTVMLSLSLIPAVLQYFILPFCPESPRFLLLNKGQESKADAALLRLRGSPEPVLAELEEMKAEAAHTQASVGVLEFFQKRSYRQPIIIVLFINLASQLSGFNAIINYSTRMFQPYFEEAKYLTLGVGAVNVVFTLVAFFLMEKAGRRRLLLIGFIIIAVCNLLLTVVDSVVQTVPALGILQVLVVFCLISAYELGPGPISWFIAGELFDQRGRSIAMAFASMLNWGGKFLLALLFPPVLKVIGGYSYLLFMVMALIGFVFTWFRVPETKGRTFDEIAEAFRGAENLPLHDKKGFNTFS
ncbi:solute carrier family 2, facilitated glucose transporter member 1 isoform X1 [Syngnathus acus]|uniref:solute carrier family 2, facilitated glucose transporter member 1 isoform X1 n=2 Tax=Syngnathus acus TaxID=161584 RepID=UPI001885D6DC|nr:solute carrier family 2, facilitated glucose transporter member 1 isoform X1 [Syngnathus acus]XP_037097191.1 solute carrier family 2, facilitated glucose transporter member 1 isoform X1 [Syngnathus acus]XP_037097193.1 solute carrier family 2, facilitated glucose transporter member 1 isoform X1 [Syngnathus acus]